MRKIILAAVLVVVLAFEAKAQTLVTITDTIYSGDGTTPSGSLILSWPSFTAADGTDVGAGSKTFTITNGIVSLTLVPNAGATPSGTSYTADFRFKGVGQSLETWVVPATGPVGLGAVRVLSVPTPTATYITMLNTLTAATQTFAVGTAGTDFGISSSGSVHTFNLPAASATSTGKLLAADWTSFNAKESALTFNSPLSRIGNTISCPTCGGGGGGVTHQLDGVNLIAQDPINFQDTTEIDWTNPNLGNIQATLKAASIADAKLTSNYSGVGSCTNQFARALNDNAAPTCASVAGTDFASQTANTVFAAPNGATGAPSFRLLVDADVPSTLVRTSRAVNTSSPLGGGGALSADLTLTCLTCEVTGNKNAANGYAGLNASSQVASLNGGTENSYFAVTGPATAKRIFTFPNADATIEYQANKNAASGYAGLTSDTKLNASQGQEVWASTDLTDFATKSGTGTTIMGATFTSLATNDLPKWNGTNWVNSISAAKADALTNDPTDCGSNQYATAIAASGNLTCSQPATSNLSDGSNVVKNNQSNAYSTGTQDFETAAVTRPFRRLAFASFPGTCTANREFLERSDPATAGQVIYVCNSGGTGWDLVGDGGAGGGANTALSNLASVAVNISLLPGADNSIDLGSAAKQWKDIYFSGALIGGGAGPPSMEGTPGTCAVAAASKGKWCLSSTGNVFGYSYDGGAYVYPQFTNQKDAASGYAGLTTGTKLNAAQGQEIWASTDLTDFATKSGTGTTIMGATFTSLAANDLPIWNGANWVNSTAAPKATALAANGSNCATNQYAQGVDASGAAEGCAQLSTASLSDGADVVKRNQANTYSGGGLQDLSAQKLALPASTTLPGTCTANKEIFVDTDATPAGQQVYLCNSSGNGWNLIGDGGAGGGDNISVNGAAATDADFDDATPAAPSNSINVKWQKDALTPNNLSAYVPYAAPLTVTGGNLTINQNAGTDVTADLEEETHASEHQHGGADEVATATPAANAIPKADAGGTLNDGWLSANVSKLGSSIDTAEITDANVTPAKVSAVLKTRIFGYQMGVDNGAVLADTDDQQTIWINWTGQDVTLEEIYCECDAGSPTVNFLRDDDTPSNILTSNLTVASTGACARATAVSSTINPSVTCVATLSATEKVLSAGYRVDWSTVAAGGTAKRISCFGKGSL